MEQPASPKVLRAAGMRWDEDGMMARGGEMEGGGERRIQKILHQCQGSQRV